MTECLILYVIHISGTRMQEFGVDTLSRGNNTEGVMIGNQLISYLSLHLKALIKSKQLLDCLLKYSLGVMFYGIIHL